MCRLSVHIMLNIMLRVSVSALESDYVRITIGFGSIDFFRVGRMVIIRMHNVTAKVFGSCGTTFISTVPEGFRPNDQLRQRCQVANCDNDMSSGLWIQTGGAMYISNFGGTGLSGTYSFSCTSTGSRLRRRRRCDTLTYSQYS